MLCLSRSMEFILNLLYLAGHIHWVRALCQGLGPEDSGHILVSFKISSVCMLAPSSFETQCLRPGLEIYWLSTYLEQTWGLVHLQQQFVLKKTMTYQCYEFASSSPLAIPCVQGTFHLVNYETLTWKAPEAPGWGLERRDYMNDCLSPTTSRTRK